MDVGGIELISHVPAKLKHPSPVLFVHGAFVAAWCWDDHFLPYFAKRGYAAHALSLRGRTMTPPVDKEPPCRPSRSQRSSGVTTAPVFDPSGASEQTQ